MSDSSISEPSLKSTAQKIGWFTAACVLVSNIIGGGIFTTTGLMARDVGELRHVPELRFARDAGVAL